jgi:hypothetical protein
VAASEEIMSYQKEKTGSAGGSTSAATIVLLALVCGVYVLYPETETAVMRAMTYLRVL